MRHFDDAAVPDRADPEMVAMESAEIRECGSGAGFWDGGVVHDKHELAGVQRRKHDELPDADGRAGVSQLRFGGGGNRAGPRRDSRDCAERDREAWKFLGGYDAVSSVVAVALLRGRRARAGFAGRGAKPETVYDCRFASAVRRASYR